MRFNAQHTRWDWRALLVVGALCAIVVLHRQRSWQLQQNSLSIQTFDLPFSGPTLDLSAFGPMFKDPNCDPVTESIAFAASSAAPATQDPDTAPYGGFGQWSEDVYAYDHFFFQMKNGIFLELGAFDGYTFSNSFMYEQSLGWKGLLIEAGTTNFARLQRIRPGALKLNAVVCNESRAVTYLESGVAGGIKELMSNAHLKRLGKSFTSASSVRLPCVPLQAILDAANVSHVNFFSLAIEGAELSVLRSLDFESTTFDAIVVKSNGEDARKDQACKRLLEEHGYRFLTNIATSAWFVRNGFAMQATTETDPRRRVARPL